MERIGRPPALAERTVYTWKSAGTTEDDDDDDDARLPIVASQPVRIDPETGRQTDGQAGTETDRQTSRQASTVYLFFWWSRFCLSIFFFSRFSRLEGPKKASTVRAVFEYFQTYYFKQLTLGCLSVLCGIRVALISCCCALIPTHTHTHTFTRSRHTCNLFDLRLKIC